MERLSGLNQFQQYQNIVLQGFDPVSASGFTQVPNFILNNQQLTPNAKVIYAKLLSYAWHNNAVFPGQDKMAVEIGSSQQSVSRGIKELEDAGYLMITRRGQGMTNIYTLHHTVKRKRRK
jgi:biotin operon repressor